MSRVYFLFYGAVGSLVPYLSPHYRDLGLSGVEISLLGSVGPAMLFVSQAIFGPLADRSGNRARVLSTLLVAAGVAGSSIALGRGFWSTLALVILWTFCNSPIGSLADSIALSEALHTGIPYPRIRLWGSLGFFLVTVLGGRVFDRWGRGLAFALYGALMLVAAAAARRAPAQGPRASQPVWPQLLRLALTPQVGSFLAFSCLIHVAIAGYTTFYSVRLVEVGGSNALLGAAWGLAALTEVPMWLWMSRWQRKPHPLSLLSLAAFTFALRWWLCGSISIPWVLAALQAFHAFSFAVYQPTAVEYMARLVPPELRSSGQGLLMVANAGLGFILGSMVAGQLVDLAGTAVMFKVMAALSLLAGIGLAILRVRQPAWAVAPETRG